MIGSRSLWGFWLTRRDLFGTGGVCSETSAVGALQGTPQEPGTAGEGGDLARASASAPAVSTLSIVPLLTKLGAPYFAKAWGVPCGRHPGEWF